MKNPDLSEDLLRLEEQLRSMKPAETPAPLSEKLLRIATPTTPASPCQCRSVSICQKWIPLAAAAVLTLCFVGLYLSNQPQKEPTVAQTLELPTFQQVKEQTQGMVEISKTLVQAYTEQSPAQTLFKSISKEELMQLASQLDQATAQARLSEAQRKRLREGTDVTLGVLASGAPPLATLALATPALFEKSKNDQ